MAKKIAVIGGGIFGCTTAIKLAEAGYEVHLFEQEPKIMMGASGSNQFRLHRGYHYPRSQSTALSSKAAEISFRKEYGDAVRDNSQHYYVIAKEKSKVSGQEFLAFCDKCGLEYTKAVFPGMNMDMVETSILGKESQYDPIRLTEIVNDKLKLAGVSLHLGVSVFLRDVAFYDVVINASYAGINNFLGEMTGRKEYQFEICEKPVLRLPDSFRNKSVVVLDGPFFCIDPYGSTPFHVMGNVVHAIQKTNVGLTADIPEKFKPLIHKGIIQKPPITHIEKFIDLAKDFIPEIEQAEHVGSFFTIRTVLPDVDATDERPTIVTRLNERLIQVFSGKVGNCVEAAGQIVDMVQKM